MERGHEFVLRLERDHGAREGLSFSLNGETTFAAKGSSKALRWDRP